MANLTWHASKYKVHKLHRSLVPTRAHEGPCPHPIVRICSSQELGGTSAPAVRLIQTHAHTVAPKSDKAWAVKNLTRHFDTVYRVYSWLQGLF